MGLPRDEEKTGQGDRRQKTVFKNEWRKSDSRSRSSLDKTVNVFSYNVRIRLDFVTD